MPPRMLNGFRRSHTVRLSWNDTAALGEFAHDAQRLLRVPREPSELRDDALITLAYRGERARDDDLPVKPWSKKIRLSSTPSSRRSARCRSRSRSTVDTRK